MVFNCACKVQKVQPMHSEKWKGNEILLSENWYKFLLYLVPVLWISVSAYSHVAPNVCVDKLCYRKTTVWAWDAEW